MRAATNLTTKTRAANAPRVGLVSATLLAAVLLSSPGVVKAEDDPVDDATVTTTNDVPVGATPGEDKPLPDTVEVEEIFGACANQGPVISGQLLTRINIAAPLWSEVTNISVRADGARVKEIEIPYYDWLTRRDGEGVVSSGPAVKRKSFWLWVALDKVAETATEVEIRIEAKLADGGRVSHGGEGSKLPAFRIPVTPELLANAPKADPSAPADAPEAALETPLNGRTPCRIGEPTAELAGTSPLPLIGTGLAGILLGAAGAFLVRRRRR